HYVCACKFDQLSCSVKGNTVATCENLHSELFAKNEGDGTTSILVRLLHFLSKILGVVFARGKILNIHIFVIKNIIVSDNSHMFFLILEEMTYYKTWFFAYKYDNHHKIFIVFQLNCNCFLSLYFHDISTVGLRFPLHKMLNNITIILREDVKVRRWFGLSEEKLDEVSENFEIAETERDRSPDNKSDAWAEPAPKLRGPYALVAVAVVQGTEEKPMDENQIYDRDGKTMLEDESSQTNKFPCHRGNLINYRKIFNIHIFVIKNIIVLDNSHMFFFILEEM
ncbi:hypothetical protein ACJX0J_036796, partial [Zea mays]